MMQYVSQYFILQNQSNKGIKMLKDKNFYFSIKTCQNTNSHFNNCFN